MTFPADQLDLRVVCLSSIPLALVFIRMSQVFLPIVRIFFGERRVLNDQQVFRVAFLCRFGEVETSRQNRVRINHHDFVVGYGVLRINPRRHAGMKQEIGFRVFVPALALVEDDLDFHPALFGVHQRLCNRRRREGIRLDEHGGLGLAKLPNDGFRAAAFRREINLDVRRRRVDREREQQDKKDSFHFPNSGFNQTFAKAKYSFHFGSHL